MTSRNMAYNDVPDHIEQLFLEHGFTSFRMRDARLLYLYLNGSCSPLCVNEIKANYGGDPLRADVLLVNFENLGLIDVADRGIFGAASMVQLRKE